MGNYNSEYTGQSKRKKGAEKKSLPTNVTHVERGERIVGTLTTPPLPPTKTTASNERLVCNEDT